MKRIKRNVSADISSALISAIDVEDSDTESSEEENVDSFVKKRSPKRFLARLRSKKRNEQLHSVYLFNSLSDERLRHQLSNWLLSESGYAAMNSKQVKAYLEDRFRALNGAQIFDVLSVLHRFETTECESRSDFVQLYIWMLNSSLTDKKL